MVTVTGTENLLMAAALAEGETVLENAAQEPEVGDLAELLVAMGARIEGPARAASASRASTRLHAAEARAPHHPRPHRGRHLPRARRRRPAATCSLKDARAEHLDAVIDKLREAGADDRTRATGWIRVQRARPRRAR